MRIPAPLLALALACAVSFPTVPAVASAQATFRLTSPTVRDGARIPLEHVFGGFGCTGANVSPALAWTNAPAATKSFAITMYDPDAPTGSGWWHWTVFNLPASVTSLPAGAGSAGGTLPSGAVQGRTDFGASGYGGPCPPPGTPHRYIFTVYALKVSALELDAQAGGAMVGFNLNANVLAKATLTGLFGR
ncbi:MAG: YbhB/YbcL family Raf kinase inhibitor-like protein [Gemmatimonadaceae bacterium]|jgi:hypothetical protein|nr:YbhB/YbcL family Raf kinase inhibitor-like protein [Gemmatimonadaceae bacterium]